MNLIEGIQEEMNRVRNELLPQYEAIGPAGMFGVAEIKGAIKQGEQAIASGDPIASLQAYERLKSITG